MIQEIIEIPFGAYDSELKGWEYTIPEGFTAEIKGGKVIVKEKESEDERIRKDIISHFESIKALALYDDNQEESDGAISSCNEKIAWLEKQKEQKPTEWSEEDEQHLNWLCRIIHSRKNHGELSLAEESELGNWIDKWINHNPQSHWKPSEE